MQLMQPGQTVKLSNSTEMISLSVDHRSTMDRFGKYMIELAFSKTHTSESQVSAQGAVQYYAAHATTPTVRASYRINIIATNAKHIKQMKIDLRTHVKGTDYSMIVDHEPVKSYLFVRKGTENVLKLTVVSEIGKKDIQIESQSKYVQIIANKVGADSLITLKTDKNDGKGLLVIDIINRLQESGEKHLKTVFRLPHTGKEYSVKVAVSQNEQKKIQVVFGMSPKPEDHIGLEMVAASSNKFQIGLIDGRSLRGPTLEAVVDQTVRPTAVHVSYKKHDKSEPKVLISSQLTKLSHESYVMNSHILESMFVSSLTKLATSGIHQEYLFEGALSTRNHRSVGAFSVKIGSPLYIKVHVGKNQPKSYAVSLGVDKRSKIVARVDMITTSKNRPVVGLTTSIETSKLLTSQVDYDMDELSHINQMLQAFIKEQIPTIKEKIHDITKMIISDAKEVYPNLQKSIEELVKLIEVILEDPTFKHFRALIEESLISVRQSVEGIWKWLIETLEKLKTKAIEFLSLASSL